MGRLTSEAQKRRAQGKSPAASQATRQPRTVIELRGVRADEVDITGRVRFFERRCPGAEITAARGAGPVPSSVSLGVFHPGESGARFEATIGDLAGRPLSLEIRSSPESPEMIDFCTLALDALAVDVRR